MGPLGVAFWWFDCLKIKLLEITEEVGVWVTHNDGPILVTALLQCQNKKIHLGQRQSKVILKDRLFYRWVTGCRAHPAPKCSARFSQKYESNHKENVLDNCLKSHQAKESHSTLGNTCDVVNRISAVCHFLTHYILSSHSHGRYCDGKPLIINILEKLWSATAGSNRSFLTSLLNMVL